VKKCLVTGCSGFIGSHLADFLIDKRLIVVGTTFPDSGATKHIREKATFVNCDFRDKDNVTEVVRQANPDYVFHLAAQSLVLPSWEDAENTFKANILGTLYLLEAIKNQGINPVIVIACSSAEYGLTSKDEIPIKESKEFRPVSPYGVSKIGTDYLSYLYWKVYDMHIIRIRPFNVTGPRKLFDATSDFARGIVEMERGYKQSLQVGNLESVRDILDIRDAVRAMWLLAERGIPGEVYNICSGKGYRIAQILEQLISLSKVKVDVCRSNNKLRPLDESVYIGDNSKLCNLGWKQEIPLEQTLRDTLNYWRNES
jgi:GDP-4-dehydro-6-deoxy-D-mannose reductase